jgi:prolyl-tRNA synthetase
MNCTFTNRDGRQKYLQMGAYGIGIGRAMAIIVEAHHDEKGIIWPKSVAPYQAYLIGVNRESSIIAKRQAEVYETLTEAGIEVLWDDREEVSAGEKFANADLIGLPVRLVISPKTGSQIEFKRRDLDQTELLSLDQIIGRSKDEKNRHSSQS